MDYKDPHPDNLHMVRYLVDFGVLKSPRIKDAFLSVDRKKFVLPEQQSSAYEDHPLILNDHATISQPYTVACMLEWLQAQPGETILEVGSGSGWVVGLLGYIVGPSGMVYGVEVDPELVAFGRKNIEKIGQSPTQILQAGEVLGYPEKAPFDKIIVSAAAAHEVPQLLLDQLKIGGVLVMPVIDSIVRIHKISQHQIEQEKIEGFAFVPLQE